MSYLIYIQDRASHAFEVVYESSYALEVKLEIRAYAVQAIKKYS